MSLRTLLPLSMSLLLAACTGGDSEPGPPEIRAFTASPEITNAGRAVRLQWDVRDADELVLVPGPFDVLGQSGIEVTTGAGTNRYTLTARNASGISAAPLSVATWDWQPIDAVLSGALALGEVDGYSFALVDRLGELHVRADGNLDTSSSVPLASASKLPAVMALLTLVDDGLLELDRPVGDYLARDPAFRWPADKQAITLRMLLAHTSGIIGLADQQPGCLADEFRTTLRACAQIVAETALVAAPGAAFNYGGADMQIAGYIATLVTGLDWQTLFDARIGAPLELVQLSWGSPLVVRNPRIAGGARATAREYARVLQTLLDDGRYDGEQVLSVAAIAELERDEIGGLPVLNEPFPNGREADFPSGGLGVFIAAPSLHPGSAGPEFSDPGLFGATPWYDRDLGYGAVVLIERTTEQGLALQDAIRPLIIRERTR